MQPLIIKDTDFFSYKEQLKSFLKGQTRFKDYDFEGSNMSVLLDVLSYNTYQNSFYNNMSINEMFLDSAVLENSVLSHAKTLNYLPRSVTSSSSTISFDILVPDNIPFVTIPIYTRFSASSSGKSFSFYTNETLTVFKNDKGVFNTGCIDVFEGELTTEKYFAKQDTNFQYRISNLDVDTASISVFVTDSDGNKVEYSKRLDLYELNQDSRVFFVQCTDGYYEIYFGQDVFGKQPKQNEIIEIIYRISSGEKSNGASKFSGPAKISGYPISDIKTISASYGGANRENIDDIKYYAPRIYQIKDRAVTENDYELLLKNQFPEIQAVSAMGGENLVPPQFGKVAIYVDTVGADGISENIKEKITNHIKRRTPLGIEPLIYSADFMHVQVQSLITYDNNISNKTSADIRQSVLEKIVNYSDNKLNKFGVTLRYSDLISNISNADDTILSNQTRLMLFTEQIPELSKNNRYVINFNNESVPIADFAIRSLQSQVPNHPVIPKLDAEQSDRLPTVFTSNFLYDGKTVYIRDDGFGKLQIIQNSNDVDVILVKNVGTIDYKTGIVKIDNFVPEDIWGPFKIYLSPKYLDINTPKNAILSIRHEDIAVEVKIKE